MALVFSYGYCCGIFLYNCGGLFTLNVATFANAMGVVFFLSMWSSFSDLMVVVFCIVTMLVFFSLVVVVFLILNVVSFVIAMEVVFFTLNVVLSPHCCGSGLFSI